MCGEIAVRDGDVGQVGQLNDGRELGNDVLAGAVPGVYAAERDRPKRPDAAPAPREAVPDDGVNVLGSRHTVRHEPRALANECELQPVPDEAGHVAAHDDRLLPERAEDIHHPLDQLLARALSRGHLHRPHEERRVEVVRSDDALRLADRIAQRRYGNRRGVRREHGGRRYAGHGRKKLRLQLELLGERLDREVTHERVTVEVGGHVQPPPGGGDRVWLGEAVSLEQRQGLSDPLVYGVCAARKECDLMATERVLATDLSAHQACADDQDLHGLSSQSGMIIVLSDHLDNRVAIVTGGGSGIGAATAHLLAREGQTVAVVGRRAERLEAVVAAIADHGGRAFAVPADLSDPRSPWAIVEAVLDHTGRIDVIVHCAASFTLKPAEECTLDEFDDHIAVNVRAAYFLVQAALPSLRASPAAVVVNVSSAAAVMYRRRQTLYGLTKAALEHMTRNLAAELAPDGIRVNCVRPGPVSTEIHTGAVADPAARLAELGRLVPLGRVGEADEIALWIGHVVARNAEWVTGAVLAIDGGRILGPPET